MEKEQEKAKDIYLKCIECGNDFIFEAGEREYYKRKGLYLPKRCPACRMARKLSNGSEEVANER